MGARRDGGKLWENAVETAGPAGLMGSRVAAGLAAANALAPTGPFGAAQALADPKSKLRRPGFGPHSSLKDETFLPSIDLDGKLPQWLTGSARCATARPFRDRRGKFNHWFDGLAMLHAFLQGRQGPVTRNWLPLRLHSTGPGSAKAGSFSELATDPAPGPLSPDLLRRLDPAGAGPDPQRKRLDRETGGRVLPTPKS